MKRTAHLLALVASTSMIAGCGTDAQLKIRPVGAQAVLPVNDLVAEARLNFALNNVTLALEQFRRAVRLQPENVDALNGIAACYDRVGRFDLSRTYYERALALAPDNAKTLHNFQLSLTMQGRRDEATALAHRAVQPKPQAPALDLPALPAAPPSQVEVAGEAPPRAPRLERVSLGEVQLVSATSSKALPTKQAHKAKPQPMGRVVQVTRAERLKETRTSSEWVFPEEPAFIPAAKLAAVPAPAPVEAPADTPPVRKVVYAPDAAPEPTARAAVMPSPAPKVAATAPTVPAPAPVEDPADPAPVGKVVYAPDAALAPAARAALMPKPLAAAPAVPLARTEVRAPIFAPTPAARTVSARPAAAAPAPLRSVKSAAPAVRTAARRPSPAAAPPRVQVLNAVGRKGLAGRYGRYLNARGWAESRAADARRMRKATVILYPAGSRAQAAALARRLPFRAVVAPAKGRRRGSDLMLVLGSDALAFDNRLRLRVARA